MRNAQLLLLITILCGHFIVSCATTESTVPIDQYHDYIVARVNGAPIRQAEYKQELDSNYQRFHNTGQMIDGLMYEQLKTEVRESLINLRLLNQYGLKEGVQIDLAQVDKYYQDSVAKYSSKRAYERSIKRAGMSEGDIKERIRRTLVAQKVVDAFVKPKVMVTDEEVKAYYDANPHEFEHDVLVRASHILVKVSPWADDDTKARARSKISGIREKLQAGADFAELAKKYSEGPSKVNGGDLGYFGAAQMAPAFETAAFSLNPGEISNVVTTQFGYHLIKVFDRKPAGKETLAEAAPILKSRFEKERMNTHMRQLVDKLKADAQIERFELKK